MTDEDKKTLRTFWLFKHLISFIGGRSVGTVRSRTQTMELLFLSPSLAQIIKELTVTTTGQQ
jgi:hypothetical protein